MALIITIATLIAVFIGPSSALLVIPTTSDWPAGGTSFWMSGKASELWPLTLDRASTGGDICLDPTQDQIYANLLSMSGCIWYGTPAIQEHVVDVHGAVFEGNITITDGVTTRAIQRRGDGPNTAANFFVSSMANVSRFSNVIGLMWINAISWAASTSSLLSSRRNYSYRQRGGSIASVKSLIPVVRTQVTITSPVKFSNTSEFKVNCYEPFLTTHSN